MMKKLKTAFTMQKLKAVLNKQDIAKTTSIEIGGVDSYPMIGEKCYCIFYVRDAVNSAKFSSLLTVCESYGVRPVIFGKRMTRENADKVLSSQRFAIEKNMRTKKIGVSYEEKQLENDRLKRKYQMILEIEAKLDDKDGKEKSDYVCECNMLLVLYASDSKTLDTVDKKFKSVMRGMGFYLVTPVEQKVIYEKKLIRKEESSIDDEYRLYFTGEMMDSFMKYAFPASQQYKSGLPIGRRKNGEYIFFDPAKTKAGGRGIYIGESESGKTHLLLLQMYNDTILGKRQAYLDPLGAVKTSNSPLKAAERIKERFKNKKVYIQKYTYTEDTAGIDLFNVFPNSRKLQESFEIDALNVLSGGLKYEQTAYIQGILEKMREARMKITLDALIAQIGEWRKKCAQNSCSDLDKVEEALRFFANKNSCPWLNVNVKPIDLINADIIVHDLGAIKNLKTKKAITNIILLIEEKIADLIPRQNVVAIDEFQTVCEGDPDLGQPTTWEIIDRFYREGRKLMTEIRTLIQNADVLRSQEGKDMLTNLSYAFIFSVSGEDLLKEYMGMKDEDFDWLRENSARGVAILKEKEKDATPVYIGVTRFIHHIITGDTKTFKQHPMSKEKAYFYRADELHDDERDALFLGGFMQTPHEELSGEAQTFLHLPADDPERFLDMQLMLKSIEFFEKRTGVYIEKDVDYYNGFIKANEIVLHIPSYKKVPIGHSILDMMDTFLKKKGWESKDWFVFSNSLNGNTPSIKDVVAKRTIHKKGFELFLHEKFNS